VARETLETISLWKNGIGVEGMRAIAKPLAALPRLTQLNLFRNRLGDSGSALLCKQLSLGACAQTLHTLWLSDNNIHTFPADILSIKGLVRLFLNANKIRLVPKALGELEHLTQVCLDSCTVHATVCCLEFCCQCHARLGRGDRAGERGREGERERGEKRESVNLVRRQNLTYSPCAGGSRP